MGRAPPVKTVTSPMEILQRCKDIKNRFFPRQDKSAFVIIDLETTGLDVQNDWAIEVAALFVTSHNGDYQPVHAFHSYFDWAGSGLANSGLFRARLDATNRIMQEKDPGVHRMSYEELLALGKNPKQVVTDLGFLMRDFFQKMGTTCHTAICGHNVFYFDANFLHHTFSKLGVESPLIPSMVDTGLIVKAAQINDYRVEITSDTMLVDWIKEVRNLRASVKWALHKFCGPTFDLKRKLPDYVLSIPHSALTDAWSVFALLKMFDN